MIIEIDGKKYDVEIIKKNNRNTYIRVRDGKIIVTTNYLVSKKSIINLINDNISSIKKMIDRDNKRTVKESEFYFFGKKYDIVYGFNEIEFSSDKIYAYDRKSFDKYINNEIVRIYSERLNYYYNLFEERIPIPNLKIRKMSSRWGVCNTKNHNVTLNYQLSRYDIECLNYVIVHELCHFIHPNHSKNFWLLVVKYYPEYKKIRKILKD